MKKGWLSGNEITTKTEKMRKTLNLKSNLQKASKFKSNNKNKKETLPHIFGYVDLRDLVFIVARWPLCMLANVVLCMFVGINVPFSSVTSPHRVDLGQW